MVEPRTDGQVHEHEKRRKNPSSNTTSGSVNGVAREKKDRSAVL